MKIGNKQIDQVPTALYVWREFAKQNTIVWSASQHLVQLTRIGMDLDMRFLLFRIRFVNTVFRARLFCLRRASNADQDLTRNVAFLARILVAFGK